MDTALAKKLTAAKAAFKNARTTVEAGGSGDFFTPEPGRKKVQITEAEVNTSQNDRLQCYFGLTILEGEEANQTFRKYYGLDEQGMEYLLKDIARLELEMPNDVAELPALLESIVASNMVLSVRVKEKGEYLNTYFDKLLKGEDAPAPAAKAPKAAAPAPAAPAPELAAAAAPQSQDDEIAVGKDLMVEGEGVGTVTSINEAKGEVSLFVIDKKKMVTVGVDRLSLAPAPTPAPAAMRVSKK